MAKTLVITGGSKGIGLEISIKFLENGWNVVSGSRAIQSFKDSEIESQIKQVVMNADEQKAHSELIQVAIGLYTTVDCYINNAGFSEWKSLKDIDGSFLDQILKTNLMGYFWGSQAAAKVLKPGNSIINISSLAGRRGTSKNSAYVSAKFGVTGLTQSLCKELGSIGIRVNAVCPVLIETPGLKNALSKSDSPALGNASKFLKDFADNQSALGRLPTAREVANLVFFLASDEAVVSPDNR